VKRLIYDNTDSKKFALLNKMDLVEKVDEDIVV